MAFESGDGHTRILAAADESLLSGVWDHTAKMWSDVVHGRATAGQYLECGLETAAAAAVVFGGYKGVSKLMSMGERNPGLARTALSLESASGLGGRTIGTAEKALAPAALIGDHAAAHAAGLAALAEKGAAPVARLGERAAGLAGSTGAIEGLPAKVQGLMLHGAEFPVINPKTGTTLETVVSIVHNEAGKAETILSTRAGEQVAKIRAWAVEPPPGSISPEFLYGHPRTKQSFLWLDYMGIQPEFQGMGVRESVVSSLRQHSLDLGLGGRIKLQAATDFKTVSAIPWYKAGFRPQVGSVFHGEKFESAASALESAVKTNTRLSLEEGQRFNNLLMYLPDLKVN